MLTHGVRNGRSLFLRIHKNSFAREIREGSEMSKLFYFTSPNFAVYAGNNPVKTAGLYRWAPSSPFGPAVSADRRRKGTDRGNCSHPARPAGRGQSSRFLIISLPSCVQVGRVRTCRVSLLLRVAFILQAFAMKSSLRSTVMPFVWRPSAERKRTFRSSAPEAGRDAVQRHLPEARLVHHLSV